MAIKGEYEMTVISVVLRCFWKKVTEWREENKSQKGNVRD